MKLALIVLLAALPPAGTQFQPLPPGPAKAKVEAACYACHSADIIVQQRLTAKQWTAVVEKMARWGAVVPEKEKGGMVEYLAKHFGVGNTRFAPIRVAPVNK